MAEPVKIWFEDDNRVLANYGNCLVQVWRGANTFGRYRSEVGGILRNLVAAHPAGVVGLMLAEEAADMPSEAGRREVSEIWGTYQGKIHGSALMIAGTSMRASAVRAAATTVSVLTKRQEPFKIFSEVRPSVEWLGTTMQGCALHTDVDGAVQFIERVRRKKAA